MCPPVCPSRLTLPCLRSRTDRSPETRHGHAAIYRPVPQSPPRSASERIPRRWRHASQESGVSPRSVDRDPRCPEISVARTLRWRGAWWCSDNPCVCARSSRGRISRPCASGAQDRGSRAILRHEADSGILWRREGSAGFFPARCSCRECWTSCGCAGEWSELA